MLKKGKTGFDSYMDRKLMEKLESFEVDAHHNVERVRVINGYF